MAGLTLIFALFAAPAALATFPGKNGQILFTRLLFRDPSAEDDNTERFSLGVVRPDGKNQHRLQTCRVVARCTDSNGSYSPSGKRILFHRRNRLVITRADGSHPIGIPVPDGLQPDDPAWSPDGRRVAFTGGLGAGLTSVFVVGVRGQGLRRLTDGEFDSQPAWSVEDEIVFLRENGDLPGSDLFVVGSDGARQRRLARVGRSPAWSPDGRRVAFASRLQIHSIRADGTGRKALGRGLDPTWSPDGRMIAFKRFRGLRVMSRHGGAQRVIATTKSIPHVRADEELFAPDWRPRP